MKAVVTAGGEGTRLYPSSRAFPKELFHFQGKPVIEYGIDLLRDAGINDIFVVTGRKKGALQDYFGSGETFGVNIAYITQEEPKGLGDAVLCTKPYIKDSKDDSFVLLLGDTIFKGSNDLEEMLKIHSKEKSTSTILVEKVQEPERYGVVKFESVADNCGKIKDLYEKPEAKDVKDNFCFDGGWFSIAGLYVFNKKIFDFLENISPGANNELQLTDAVKESLKDSASYGFVMKGKRIDVGTWDYMEAEREEYINTSLEELREIISGKKALMEKMKSNKR
ncbi:MAG: NTP transferase domain-containing protein [Nanoarchaeota archaeon]|nr:NTP transferase domain-containing protein [Nanoarchaeota archaeon]